MKKYIKTGKCGGNPLAPIFAQVKKNKYRERMFENIYDILIESTFKEEARKEMRKFLKNKEYEWDPAKGTISLGKKFKIKLCEK